MRPATPTRSIPCRGRCAVPVGGLLASWAKDVKIGARLINARSETITEKPSFRAAAARRRCLIGGRLFRVDEDRWP
jgi:putative SOS response-associated peptidase YedK